MRLGGGNDASSPSIVRLITIVTRVSRRSTRGIDVKDRSHAAGGGTCSDSLDVRFCNRSQLSDSVKLVAEKNPAKMFARVLSTWKGKYLER